MKGDDVTLILVFAAILGVGMFIHDFWPLILLALVVFGIAVYYASKSQSNDRITALSYRIDELSGVEFEHCIAELVKRNGYSNVQTTKATGDFGIDIICSKNGIKHGIQCKRYAKKVGVKAVQEAIAGKQYYRLDSVIVATNTYFTPSAIEMARKGGVILWNRDYIIRMLKS